MRDRIGIRHLLPVGGALAAALLVGLVPAYAAGGRGVPPGAGTDTSTPTDTPTPTDTAATTPTPTTTPVDDRLLPDMVAVPATGLRLTFPTSGRRLRFTSSLGNVGIGPLELRPNNNRPCPTGQRNATQISYLDSNRDRHFDRPLDTAISRHHAGCMVYHPSHHHWHFTGSARYTLLDPVGATPLVSTVRKVSFCMRDSSRVPAAYGQWRYPRTYRECGRTTRQGVSVGWTDVYQSFLPGQSLPFPRRFPDGVYCLRTVVDPLDQIVETDDLDNVSVRAFAVTGTTLQRAPVTACASVVDVP